MSKKGPAYYFRTGTIFLWSHPQVLFTAFVGITILASFLFVAYRFASIAQEAQETLVQVRIGAVMDTMATFAVGDVLTDRELLRPKLESIVSSNETIKELTVIAPHDNERVVWRIHVQAEGRGEGSLVTISDPAILHVYRSAWSAPATSYTTMVMHEGERTFVTARALRNDAGIATALAVSRQGMSMADLRIEQQLRTSMTLLLVVIVLIMVLFIRHARIVDYATLYRKQLEVDEMKDSFISMASHELKSPLTVIRGYIEFLKEGTEDETKRSEYLRRIDLSAKELRQLVDDILDVSRIEMGRLRFTPEYIHPHEVLEEVVEMFQESAKSKDLTLNLVISDEVRDTGIRVDRGRLKQVMVNLVSNAVKYTMVGTITVEQKVVGGHVELSVRDSGIGMTAEQQSRLFSKFYRIEGKETAGVSGTGLGLWITKYITEHMGGKISVESIKGEGSRFVVAFPVSMTIGAAAQKTL
jgi:signal transduction histidine kinase